MTRAFPALLVTGVVAAFLVACSGVGSSPQSSNGTAAASTTAGEPTPVTPVAGLSGTAAAPEMFVEQVTGMRGCGQPLFVNLGGLSSTAAMRVERLDDPRQYVGFVTNASGQAAINGTSLFAGVCKAGSAYVLRVTANGAELARATVTMPLFRGTIEIEPAMGGCESIVVTLRQMPPSSAVSIGVTEPAPYAHNSFPLFEPPLVTNDRGFARSEPFKAPWSCHEPAVSLRARAGLTGQPATTEAELLYRIALKPDEAVPSVERWLASMGR